MKEIFKRFHKLLNICNIKKKKVGSARAKRTNLGSSVVKWMIFIIRKKNMENACETCSFIFLRQVRILELKMLFLGYVVFYIILKGTGYAEEFCKTHSDDGCLIEKESHNKYSKGNEDSNLSYLPFLSIRKRRALRRLSSFFSFLLHRVSFS